MNKQRVPYRFHGVDLWRCITCGRWYSDVHYYKNKRYKNGLQSQCKMCHSNTVYVSSDWDNRQRLNREWMARTGYNRSRRGTIETICRYKTNNAVASGKLLKPKVCSQCGSRDRTIQAHHLDYSDPFDIVWLCTVCHGKEHRKRRPTGTDPRSPRYPDGDQ